MTVQTAPELRILKSGPPPIPHKTLLQRTTPVAPEVDVASPSHVESTAAALGIATLEVINGLRPHTSVSRWLDEQLYFRVRKFAITRAELARQAPVPVSRIALKSVRVCQVSTTVVEASIVVKTANRFRAAAFRMELRRNHWILVHLETV